MAKKTLLQAKLGNYLNVFKTVHAANKTAEMRNNAPIYNWPSDLVNKISIVPNGKGLTATYPQESRHDIINREYGINGVPSPLLRDSLRGE